MLTEKLAFMNTVGDIYSFTHLFNSTDELHRELIKRDIYYHAMSKEDLASELMEYHLLKKSEKAYEGS
jgi:hypothetical protein